MDEAIGDCARDASTSLVIPTVHTRKIVNRKKTKKLSTKFALLPIADDNLLHYYCALSNPN